MEYDSEDAWRYNLTTYAEHASRGKWLPYQWCSYLANILTEAAWTKNARVIIQAPPRHGKSATSSHWFPTWYLDNFPQNRVVLASYADSLASSFGRSVRDELINNDEAWTKPDQDHGRVNDWATSDGGGMRTAGIGGSLTGFGFDLGIIDDPHKDWSEVQSAMQRQKVIDWFNSVFYTRAEPGASMVVIQTRWAQRDLVGYLLTEHDDDWTEIRLPALAEDDDPLGREKGDALCPERFSGDQLRKIKAGIGGQMFAGLYQQRPSAEEGNIILREWINYYGGPTGVKLPEIREIKISWDMNFKDTKNGSFVVGSVWGTCGAKRYLLDLCRGRWNFTTTKAKVRAMANQWPRYNEILVEDAANGPAIISELSDTVSRIIPITPKGSKGARFQSVAPLFEAGNVWLPHPSVAPWVSDFVEELVSFPNAESDDQVDSCSQALERYKGSTIYLIQMSDVGRRESPSEGLG